MRPTPSSRNIIGPIAARPRLTAGRLPMAFALIGVRRRRGTARVIAADRIGEASVASVAMTTTNSRPARMVRAGFFLPCSS